MEDQRKLHQPFGRRSLLIIIIIIIIIIIAALLLVFKKASDNIVNSVTSTISEQYSKDLNEQMTSQISQSLDDYFSDLDIMYNTLILMENVDEQKLTEYIKRVQQNEEISYLAFADSDGYLYTANGSTLGTLKFRIIGQLLNGETHVISDNESIDGQSLILIGSSFSPPIKMGEKNLSFAIIGVTNDSLSDAIILNNHYSGGYSSIIHKDGSFVVKNPSASYSGLNIYEILFQNKLVSEGDISVLKNAVNKGEAYMVTAVAKDGMPEAYLYFAPIDGTEWYTVNTIPSSFIRSSVETLQRNLTNISVIILIVFVAIACLIVIMQSISSYKLRISQDNLASALVSAEQASKSKTAFLFNMSHDIRTPMNAILGYTDVGLTHKDDVKKTTDCFQKIKTSGAHLLNLINDILEMSRIEAGRLELIEHEVDLLATIDSVTTMSHALALPKSIDFQTVIGNISNQYIFADELHLNEVMINLISNAVKYTREGGKVRFTVSQISDAVDGIATYRFEISDTGVGMSEEFQANLFEPFSRESTSTVSKTEGAGLGLSIVKNIVDIAGGTISVVSEKDHGSTFTVEFPFRVMNDDEIESFKEELNREEQSHIVSSLEGKRVLLVEDNEINREVATMLLEESGLVVHSAEDGAIAIDILKETGMGYYDYILMDIQMPVMNGFEATKAIRKMPDGDKIRIIALSANAFEEDKQASLAAGMNAHVAKPINISELLDVMSKLD